MSRFTDADIERFNAKVQMPDNVVDECWIWIGAKHSKKRGYGKFRLGGRVMNAHKASYLLFVGEVEDGLIVGHQCNVERCVNPFHLHAETQSDNMNYCVASGRHQGFERQRTATEISMAWNLDAAKLWNEAVEVAF